MMTISKQNTEYPKTMIPPGPPSPVAPPAPTEAAAETLAHKLSGLLSGSCGLTKETQFKVQAGASGNGPKRKYHVTVILDNSLPLGSYRASLDKIAENTGIRVNLRNDQLMPKKDRP